MKVGELKRNWKEFGITDDFELEIVVGSHKRFLHFDNIFPAHSQNKKRSILQIFTFGKNKGVERKP